MRTFIYQDTCPFILDKYKVDFYFSGSPAPILFIAGIAILVAVAIIGFTMQIKYLRDVEVEKQKTSQYEIWKDIVNSVPPEERAKVANNLVNAANLPEDKKKSITDQFTGFFEKLGQVGIIAIVGIGALIAYNLTKR